MSIISDVHFYLGKLNQLRSNGQPLRCPPELAQIDSPCLLPRETDESPPLWQSIEQQQQHTLSAVEQALDIVIRPEIAAFYNYQYSDHFQLSYHSLQITLLQLWNDEDFNILQQNLIAHLVTQRRLKLKPTLFIGTTQDSDKILSVDNLTGEVIIELIGKTNREVLAANLSLFLYEITDTESILIS